jgi:hypothetical protein
MSSSPTGIKRSAGGGRGEVAYERADDAQLASGERVVEKLQPMAEPKSWRDYAVWIGIGVMVVVSVVVSLYLYLAQR